MDRYLGYIGALARSARERGAALTAGWSLAAVAVASGFISYTHISALTLAYGQNWKTAHLMPVPVDGQIVIGTIYFMDGKSRWQKAGGLLLGVIPGIAESLYANWQSVASPAGTSWMASWQAHFWATVPAQAFACSTFLFERWLHNRKLARVAAGELATEQEKLIAQMTLAHERELAGLAAEHGTVTAQLATVQEHAATAAQANTALRGQVEELTARVGELQSLLARRRPARQPAAPGAAAGPGQEAARAAAPARPAHPAGAGNGSPALPEGGELAELLLKVPANKIAERYDVGRWAVNEAKKDFIAGVRVIGPDGRLEWAAAQETGNENENEEAESDAA